MRSATLSGEKPFILGLGGTLRQGSSSERCLAVSLEAAAAEGAEVEMMSGPRLRVPIYAPEEAERSDDVRLLLAAFRRADGIIIASPAYHGSISGLVKNALDYSEEMRTDPRVYFDGLAIGCIACAGGWQAAGQTMAALRSIAHALRGWPTPLGAMVNTSTNIFDSKGNMTDLSAKFQLETVGRQVVEFAKMKIASDRKPVSAGGS